jgi:hypothetical protein
MLNNLTNFFNLIVGRRIKTQLEDSDLIAIGTKQSSALGDYKPTAIKFSDLQAQLSGGGGSTETISLSSDFDVVGSLAELVPQVSFTIDQNSAYRIKIYTVYSSNNNSGQARLKILANSNIFGTGNVIGDSTAGSGSVVNNTVGVAFPGSAVFGLGGLYSDLTGPSYSEINFVFTSLLATSITFEFGCNSISNPAYAARLWQGTRFEVEKLS